MYIQVLSGAHVLIRKTIATSVYKQQTNSEGKCGFSGSRHLNDLQNWPTKNDSPVSSNVAETSRKFNDFAGTKAPFR
jgi:hypothetical protein